MAAKVWYAALECGCRYEKREEAKTQVFWTNCERHAVLAKTDVQGTRWYFNKRAWPPTVEILDELVRRAEVGCSCWPDGGHEADCPLYDGKMPGEMNPQRERYLYHSAPADDAGLLRIGRQRAL